MKIKGLGIELEESAFAWQPWTAETEMLAGMLVKWKDGEIALVGDVNESAGYCGCCSKLGDPIAFVALLEVVP